MLQEAISDLDAHCRRLGLLTGLKSVHAYVCSKSLCPSETLQEHEGSDGL